MCADSFKDGLLHNHGRLYVNWPIVIAVGQDSLEIVSNGCQNKNKKRSQFSCN